MRLLVRRHFHLDRCLSGSSFVTSLVCFVKSGDLSEVPCFGAADYALTWSETPTPRRRELQDQVQPSNNLTSEVAKASGLLSQNNQHAVSGEAVNQSQGRQRLTSSRNNSNAQLASTASGHRQSRPPQHEHEENTPSVAPLPRWKRRVLTPLQTAELLDCDDKTITRWARKGYLPAHPMGEGKKKYWRFFEDELLAWLLGQTDGAVAA